MKASSSSSDPKSSRSPQATCSIRPRTRPRPGSAPGSSSIRKLRCVVIRLSSPPLRASSAGGSCRTGIDSDRPVGLSLPIGRSMPAQVAKTRQPSRDKILDCAETLFARRGFAGTGLAEVAEHVGLGKSSLFHHFRSKAELYAAVVARILGVIEDRLMRALAAGGTAVDR